MKKDETVVTSQTSNTILGRKFDGDKLEYGLLPPFALKEVVAVLTVGAQKYERNNWIHVPDSMRRYFDAAQRHIWAWKEGESDDSETGYNHLAHAICCLMFLYEHEVKYSKEEKITYQFVDNNSQHLYNARKPL